MAKNFNRINRDIITYINHSIDQNRYAALTPEQQTEFQRERRSSYLSALKKWCDENGAIPRKNWVERNSTPDPEWMRDILKDAGEIAEKKFAGFDAKQQATLERQWVLARKAELINDYLKDLLSFISDHKLNSPVTPLDMADYEKERWTDSQLELGEQQLNKIASLCVDIDIDQMHTLIDDFNDLVDSVHATE